MKLIVILTLTSLVVAQKFNMDKYKQQLDLLCSGENKNICTKENLDFGRQFYQNRIRMMQREKYRLIKAEKLHKIQQQRLLHLLRKHFLDRHL